jgi:hypothetical protein
VEVGVGVWAEASGAGSIANASIRIIHNVKTLLVRTGRRVGKDGFMDDLLVEWDACRAWRGPEAENLFRFSPCAILHDERANTNYGFDRNPPRI